MPVIKLCWSRLGSLGSEGLTHMLGILAPSPLPKASAASDLLDSYGCFFRRGFGHCQPNQKNKTLGPSGLLLHGHVELLQNLRKRPILNHKLDSYPILPIRMPHADPEGFLLQFSGPASAASPSLQPAKAGTLKLQNPHRKNCARSPACCTL